MAIDPNAVARAYGVDLSAFGQAAMTAEEQRLRRQAAEEQRRARNEALAAENINRMADSFSKPTGIPAADARINKDVRGAIDRFSQRMAANPSLSQIQQQQLLREEFSPIMSNYTSAKNIKTYTDAAVPAMEKESPWLDMNKVRSAAYAAGIPADETLPFDATASEARIGEIGTDRSLQRQLSSPYGVRKAVSEDIDKRFPAQGFITPSQRSAVPADWEWQGRPWQALDPVTGERYNQREAVTVGDTQVPIFALQNPQSSGVTAGGVQVPALPNQYYKSLMENPAFDIEVQNYAERLVESNPEVFGKVAPETLSKIAAFQVVEDLGAAKGVKAPEERVSDATKFQRQLINDENQLRQQAYSNSLRREANSIARSAADTKSWDKIIGTPAANMFQVIARTPDGAPAFPDVLEVAPRTTDAFVMRTDGPLGVGMPEVFAVGTQGANASNATPIPTVDLNAMLNKGALLNDPSGSGDKIKLDYNPLTGELYETRMAKPFIGAEAYTQPGKTKIYKSYTEQEQILSKYAQQGGLNQQQFQKLRALPNLIQQP